MDTGLLGYLRIEILPCYIGFNKEVCRCGNNEIISFKSNVIIGCKYSKLCGIAVRFESLGNIAVGLSYNYLMIKATITVFLDLKLDGRARLDLLTDVFSSTSAVIKVI